MELDRIFTEEKNKKNIPGIYNYCDRWCERCSYSARCLSYAMEKDKSKEPETQNMSNQKFWEKLSETFKITRELIKQAAEEQGMDLEAVDTSEGDELHEKSHEYANKHPLAIMSRRYSKLTSEWFHEINHLFTIDFNEKGKSLTVTQTNEHNQIEKNEVENAVSVIRWYQFQISVKLMRALNGVIMEQDELWNDIQKDSDGSAKVSLLGIDQSLVAWGVLLTNYPAEESSILDMLVWLERLKKEIEREFPNARSFKRPGFDEDSF